MSILGDTYVLPLEVADQISELVAAHAEVYEQKWNKGENGGSYYTHHIYDQQADKFNPRWDLISDTQYHMFKLAGNPNDKK